MTAKTEQKPKTEAQLRKEIEAELKTRFEAESKEIRDRAAALAEQMAVLTDGLVAAGVVPKDIAEEDGFRAVSTALGVIRSLKSSLRAQKGAATRARNTIEEMEEAAKPRALGAIGDGLSVSELAELLEPGVEVELAFSDGREELPGMPAQSVEPDDFKVTRGRLLFTNDPLEVRGTREDPVFLAGVVLLIEGEQVAWSPLPKGVSLGLGQSVNLAGSVVFG